MEYEIMDIINSLNDSPEIAYINEMKQSKEFKTRSINLSNGSKRYFVEIDSLTIERTSPIDFTHVVIGKETKDSNYKSFGFHSSLDLAQKTLNKKQKKTYEIFIIKL